jgi:hypothetical protein
MNSDPRGDYDFPSYLLGVNSAVRDAHGQIASLRERVINALTEAGTPSKVISQVQTYFNYALAKTHDISSEADGTFGDLAEPPPSWLDNSGRDTRGETGRDGDADHDGDAGEAAGSNGNSE